MFPLLKYGVVIRSELASYKILKTLGRGSFGGVFSIMKMDSYDGFAVKAISNDNKQLNTISAEQKYAQFVTKIKSPYLVEYFEYFEDENFPKISFFVMEYCSKGSLQNSIDAFSKEEVEFVPVKRVLSTFAQISVGLYVLKENKIIHRDLKPDNVFVIEGNFVKIGDFGTAKFLQSATGFATTIVGTLLYEAPEVLKGQDYSFPCDIYSFGVLTYRFSTLKKFVQGETHDWPSEFPNRFVSLVEQMTQEDPMKRPTIEQIILSPMVREEIERLPRDSLPASLLQLFAEVAAADNTLVVQPAAVDTNANMEKRSSQAIDPEVVEFIEMTAANNPALTAADFRREFAEMSGHKASFAEVNLFLKTLQRIKSMGAGVGTNTDGVNNAGTGTGTSGSGTGKGTACGESQTGVPDANQTSNPSLESVALPLLPSFAVSSPLVSVSTPSPLDTTTSASVLSTVSVSGVSAPSSSTSSSASSNLTAISSSSSVTYAETEKEDKKALISNPFDSSAISVHAAPVVVHTRDSINSFGESAFCARFSFISNLPLFKHEIVPTALEKVLFVQDLHSVSSPVLHVLPQTIKDKVKYCNLEHYAHERFNTETPGFFKKKVDSSQNQMLCSRESLSQCLLDSLPAQLQKEAIRSFDDILLYMGWRKDAKFEKDTKMDTGLPSDVPPPSYYSTSTFSLNRHLNNRAYAQLAACIVNRVLLAPGLADEVLVQVVRQMCGNKEKRAVERCWELLYLCLLFFTPSRDFESVLVNFLDSEIAKDWLGEYEGNTVLYAQLCLDALHTTTLFTAHPSTHVPKSVPPAAKSSDRAQAIQSAAEVLGEAAVATEQTMRRMVGMLDRKRTYNTHLRHVMFHQVNKLRQLLIINLKSQNQPTILKILACLSFELPCPPAQVPLTEPVFASLHTLTTYFVPKILVYFAMKFISCNGLETKGVFRGSINKNELNEYIAVINDGVDVCEHWILPLAEKGDAVLLSAAPVPLPLAYVPLSAAYTTATRLPSPVSPSAVPALAAAAQSVVVDAPVNARFKHLNEECKDPHVYAALLKAWLRDLEEPLVPFDLYDETMVYITKAQQSFTQESDSSVVLTQFINRRYSPLNAMCIKYLIRFLRLIFVPEYCSKNMMDIENITILITPSIIRKETKDSTELMKNIPCELFFTKILLKDLRISAEEGVLFDTAEREVLEEYGIDPTIWLSVQEKVRGGK